MRLKKRPGGKKWAGWGPRGEWGAHGRGPRGGAKRGPKEGGKGGLARPRRNQRRAKSVAGEWAKRDQKGPMRPKSAGQGRLRAP